MTRELRALYCGCRFATGDKVAEGTWYGIASREAEAQRLSDRWAIRLQRSMDTANANKPLLSHMLVISPHHVTMDDIVLPRGSFVQEVGFSNGKVFVKFLPPSVGS